MIVFNRKLLISFYFCFAGKWFVWCRSELSTLLWGRCSYCFEAAGHSVSVSPCQPDSTSRRQTREHLCKSVNLSLSLSRPPPLSLSLSLSLSPSLPPSTPLSLFLRLWSMSSQWTSTFSVLLSLSISWRWSLVAVGCWSWVVLAWPLWLQSLSPWSVETSTIVHPRWSLKLGECERKFYSSRHYDTVLS